MRNRSEEFGVVLLKDWLVNPITGENCRNVAGKITLVEAKEDFGFNPKGNETNWGVEVSGPKQGVLILGCQIRAIYYGEELKLNKLNGWNLN